MQFQSDMLNIPVSIPESEELSGIGAAYAAGLATGIFDKNVFGRMSRNCYTPVMEEEERNKKYRGWQNAVRIVMTK